VAESTAANPRRSRRRWAPAEKRRLVELTLGTGASVTAIAREHGVNRTNLRQWQALYRAGKLDLHATSARIAAGATFVPVNVVRPAGRPPMKEQVASQISGGVVVQVVLTTGATLRIETRSLDAALMCALVAELRR
jgi:transposase-like protein